MKQKIISVLVLIYSVQFLISCCPDEVYEYTFNGVNSVMYTLNDNQFVEVLPQDTVNKEDLLIDITMEIDRVLVSEVWQEINKLGIQSTYAAIDCFGPTINYVNSIESIEVIAVDANNQEVDVTNDLIVQGNNVSIAEFLSFADSVYFQERFELQFGDVTNLSSEATFRIRITLTDNVVLETVTNQVNFN